MICLNPLNVGYLSTSAVELNRSVICCEPDDRFVGITLQKLLQTKLNVEETAS